MYMVMSRATTPAPTRAPAAAVPTRRRRDHIHAPIRTSRLAPQHPTAGIATRPERRGTGEQARQFRPPLLGLRWRCVRRSPGGGLRPAAVSRRRPAAWESGVEGKDKEELSKGREFERSKETKRVGTGGRVWEAVRDARVFMEKD